MNNNRLLFLVLGLNFVYSLNGFSKDIFFVVMGGYTSCGSTGPTGIGMYAPFQRLSEKVQLADSSVKVHSLISCFGSDAPPNGKTQYILSDDPSRTLSGNASVLMNEIEKVYQEKGEPLVFIAGHSYGGYLAMYLAERLKLNAKLAGLFTVDAIGPACNAFQVVIGGKACKQAPTDLKNAVILDNSAAWVNFYQTQDNWLHSGPIQEAENLLVTVRGPHTKVDSDKVTWDRIGAVVTTALSQKTPPVNK